MLADPPIDGRERQQVGRNGKARRQGESPLVPDLKSVGERKARRLEEIADRAVLGCPNVANRPLAVRGFAKEAIEHREFDTESEHTTAHHELEAGAVPHDDHRGEAMVAQAIGHVAGKNEATSGEDLLDH